MPQRISTVIVDDEPLAREGVRLLLAHYPDFEIVGEFDHVHPALDFITANPVNLVFLDIAMPGASGFDLLERLETDRPPAVVFVTAFAEHAVQAFGVRAVDYLLKPTDPERFARALENVRQHLQRLREEEVVRRLRSALGASEAEDAGPADAVETRPAMDRVAVRSNGRIRLVPTVEIDWVEADGDYVRLYVGQDSYLVRSTLSDFLIQLPADRFLRIHRSTIVQVDRIREMQTLFHGEYQILLRDGTKLKLSRGYRGAVERLVGRQL